MVFIPFGAVSSIFGAQFFSTPGEPPSDQGSASKHMDVNPDFWILWAITVPVTFVILGIWRATEQSVLESPRGGARRSFWGGLVLRDEDA
ncbi:hypothetical protein B0T25DRAFT_530788 [Lasiosphaeria hispida]|uniref:Uncharacterized protein n=1 Tax=Lasiosphaeria hispida TaxID=260671 RepID=A0AAJ0HXV2_9PEZI|nr:hypothetical protein B0T25DRAFT_530788 [Lasiosphaeria hispida]